MCHAAPPGGWWLCRVDPAGSAGGDHLGRLTGWAPHTHGLGGKGQELVGAGEGSFMGVVLKSLWPASDPPPSPQDGGCHPNTAMGPAGDRGPGHRGSCLLRVAGSRQDKAAGRIQTAQWERPHSQLRRKRCLKAGGGERALA